MEFLLLFIFKSKMKKICSICLSCQQNPMNYNMWFQLLCFVLHCFFSLLSKENEEGIKWNCARECMCVYMTIGPGLKLKKYLIHKLNLCSVIWLRNKLFLSLELVSMLYLNLMPQTLPAQMLKESISYLVSLSNSVATVNWMNRKKISIKYWQQKEKS